MSWHGRRGSIGLSVGTGFLYFPLLKRRHWKWHCRIGVVETVLDAVLELVLEEALEAALDSASDAVLEGALEVAL